MHIHMLIPQFNQKTYRLHISISLNFQHIDNKCSFLAFNSQLKCTHHRRHRIAFRQEKWMSVCSTST
uniref:Uncharacterized protein n=1 Tax=Arundo donax TaxID=35708 RepID=A0A0A9CXI4_ARUDO